MAKTHQRNKTVPTRTYPVFLSYLKGSDLQKLVRLVVKVRIFTTKCTLLYDIGNVGVKRGATVGVVAVPKRKAGILSTKRINVEVSLSSSAISGSNLGSELSSGVLTLNSVDRLTGKVELMFIMKKKKATNMSYCTIAFDVAAKTVKSLQCK
ncbi:hypothetical protein PRUPE_7G233300 [Prunus persica]|uniref:Late embryogenesis abundant protein LEA-2 subgroup domain-containing protein n=1 Tax=Prunus persica TaxID=3760 RepID=M5VUJ8_PRUPE|nr:hypothetical protein PRUPE_7G233300 [Prunus persica]